MSDLKWEEPALVDLNNIQKAEGDCVAGSIPTGGDGNCTSGVSVLSTCATGNAPDDGLP